MIAVAVAAPRSLENFSVQMPVCLWNFIGFSHHLVESALPCSLIPHPLAATPAEIAYSGMLVFAVIVSC